MTNSIGTKEWLNSTKNIIIYVNPRGVEVKEISQKNFKEVNHEEN